MSAFFGRIDEFDEAASTSDLARDMLLRSGEVPFVVRARRQTAGRGRGEHRWWSDAGSLTFTIAIDPRAHGLEFQHEPRMALAIAAGIADALEPDLSRGRLSIRWPNDLEADGKKVGGILPERINTGDGPRLLIGIGLNVTTRLDDAPPEVRSMATSLKALGLQNADTDAVFRTLLHIVPDTIASLAANDPALSSRWMARDSLRGCAVRLKVGELVETGIGCGISPDGGLILSTSTGRRLFYGGQVLR